MINFKQIELLLKTIIWGCLASGFTFVGSSWSFLFFCHLIKTRNPHLSGSLQQKIEIIKRIFYICFSSAFGITGTIISYKKTCNYASLTYNYNK